MCVQLIKTWPFIIAPWPIQTSKHCTRWFWKPRWPSAEAKSNGQLFWTWNETIFAYHSNRYSIHYGHLCFKEANGKAKSFHKTALYLLATPCNFPRNNHVQAWNKSQIIQNTTIVYHLWLLNYSVKAHCDGDFACAYIVNILKIYSANKYQKHRGRASELQSYIGRHIHSLPIKGIQFTS